MERTSDTGPRKFSIRAEAKELDRIIGGRKNLDDVKALAIYAAQYRGLDWSPLALEVPHGTDLGVNFDQPATKCLWSLMDLALQEIRVGLAIRLELHSPLFVLRVKPGLSRTLDRLGNWRSPCIARLGDFWEHHYLLLPGDWHLPPAPIIGDKKAPLSIIGPGQLVTVPPSVEPPGQEAWHWLAPPWEQPPCEPSPELLILLEDCGFISRKSATSVEDLPSWKEIYPRISHAEKLLQALLAPEESSDLYYRKILLEALGAGFQDLDLLLGLLWHAPHSELKHETDGREQLAQWAEKLQELLSPETSSSDGGIPADVLGEASADSPNEFMSELQILAAHTLMLERQLEELEDQRSSGEEGGQGGPQPGPIRDLELQNNLSELEDLRQAVEDFLASIANLSEPE